MLLQYTLSRPSVVFPYLLNKYFRAQVQAFRVSLIYFQRQWLLEMTFVSLKPTLIILLLTLDYR